MEIGASIFFNSMPSGRLKRRVTGICECSATQSESKPRTSSTTASAVGSIDVMEPFVTLSAAAAVTTRLKLATGICLVIHRDTIQTAKLVASLDQVSKGRFLFGIGCGWNAEEMEDHGTVYETRTLKKTRADRGNEGNLDQGETGISR